MRRASQVKLGAMHIANRLTLNIPVSILSVKTITSAWSLHFSVLSQSHFGKLSRYYLFAEQDKTHSSQRQRSSRAVGNV